MLTLVVTQDLPQELADSITEPGDWTPLPDEPVPTYKKIFAIAPGESRGLSGIGSTFTRSPSSRTSCMHWFAPQCSNRSRISTGEECSIENYANSLPFSTTFPW